jgi:hypothetical protein
VNTASDTERPWTAMTADEKLQQRLDAWLDPSVSFASPEAEEAYKARARRLADAICLLKTPDRVPVPLLVAEIYPLTRAGLSARDGMYDFTSGSQAFIDFNLEFQPDSMVNLAVGTLPGRMFDLLDYRAYSWPGHGCPADSFPQYNEEEWMTAEDYDHLIDDPGDFMQRTYLPRIGGAFQGFARFGNVFNLASMTRAAGYVAAWGDPEVIESVERLLAAGKEAAAWTAGLVQTQTRLKALGFPQLVGPGPAAPFDLLGDHMRGTREFALDMFRRPEKVIAACERLAPLMIRWVLDSATPNSPPCVFWPLHKGSDGYLSEEQFRTFYWPTLRTVALGLIDEGFIPLFFGEGKLDSRLEIMAADLPKGKTVWLLDRTDMALAKATLGKVAAIQGNVPLSILQTGTPDDVREYCRKLIEIAAPGGGFLLDSGAVIHQGNDENIRAMIQAARDYGVYDAHS